MGTGTYRACTDLGRQIKKRLIEREMTIKELADVLGTTPQYLSKIIHGDRSGVKYTERIRQILDIVA